MSLNSLLLNETSEEKDVGKTFPNSIMEKDVTSNPGNVSHTV